jgi:hypothetical protein
MKQASPVARMLHERLSTDVTRLGVNLAKAQRLMRLLTPKYTFELASEIA